MSDATFGQDLVCHIHHLPQVLHAQKLPFAQFILLTACSAEAQTIRALAGKVYGDSKRPITQLLYELEAKKLIHVWVDTDDQRMRNVQHTPQGTLALDRIQAALDERIKKE